MKSTKKSLLISILSITLCVAMLLGTTYAWFTDSVQSGKNTIVAGNLDVELYHQSKNVAKEEVTANTTNLFQDVAKWEPGAYAYETFTVKNVGDLALKYSMRLNASNATKTTVDGVKHDLTEVLKVKVVDTAPTERPAYTNGVALKDWELDSNDVALYPEVASGEQPTDKPCEKTFTVVIYWEPGENDNWFNLNNERKNDTRLSVDVNVVLEATQYTYEEDSFDEKYDENATYSETVSQKVVAGKDTVFTSFVTPGNEDGKTTTITVPKNVASFTPESTTTMKIEATPTLSANHKFTISSNGAVGAIDLTVKVNDEVIDQFKDGSGNSVPVIVETYVAKNMTNVSLSYDNGAENWTQVENENDLDNVGKLYYDKNTGRLCYMTTHFSTFVLGANEVAYIESTNTAYLTVADAVKAAKNGDTVYLLKNDMLTGDVIIDKNVTVDFAGKTVECGSYFIKITGDVSITGNGKLNKEEANSTTSLTYSGITGYTATFKGAVYIGDNAKLTIKNGSYTTKTSSLFVCNNGILTMEDGLFKCTSTNYYDTKGLIDVCGQNGVLNLLGGSVECYENCGDYEGMYGVSAWDGGTMNLGSANTAGPTVHSYYAAIATNGNSAPVFINVYSGNYISDLDSGFVSDSYSAYQDMNVIQISANTVDGTEVNIYGGKFEQTAKNNKTGHIIEVRWESKKTINIYGGEFICNAEVIHKDSALGEANTAIAVSGGTFSSDPTDFVADGYTATKTDNVWKVVPEN